ncbi:cobalt/nickel transport protein [Rhodobacter viridis]|uniref:Cobalt transport protein CbiN n=1 Tax=Rhodobacter viridis TaxID=1054202 RepID=A0A318TQQ7_9RHOB|nr:energy-coupling factor ABC transporter substrate-binding protein [Rhodobacter viridis]PYF07141.1 cobalt/nickel transport protein [Rhodobacter viridis]
MVCKRTLALMGATLALVALPLLFVSGEFAGTDDQASAAIEATKPGFTPWAAPLWEPPSGEIESLLFASQAALGALIIGYVIGRRHERAKAETAKTESKSAPRAVATPAE